MFSKNIFIQALLTIVLTGLVQLFLPWWTMVIPCLLIGFLYGQSGRTSFATGLLSVGLLWAGLAILISQQTESTLPVQISNLFPGKSGLVLIILTGLTGGLTGGFASLTGYLVRRLV
ncbi:MAG: hypothetical protein ACO3FI_12790 [Cyclobacteriaceae bacterium]